MQTVHVRVNDAATGKPTPCRVRFTDASGKYQAPLGRRSEFPSNLASCAEGNIYDGAQPWAYIDGTCEIQLPPGSISVAIRKGIEYASLDTTLDLVPGQLSMRFALERWTDWRQKGWYAGDGRVHFGSPHEVLLQAAGDDLAIVNLLVEEDLVGAMPNMVAFSGQEPCLEKPGHMVVVNTHNIYPNWGSVGLLNCHRVVYPLRLGRKGEGEWTMADWCEQCHRKEGLVVWTDDSSNQSRLPSEALADLLLGKIDALEWSGEHLHQTSLNDWSCLLSAGIKIPLIGSSVARDNSQMLGRPRTYCALQAGEALTYRNWIEAVRTGSTFVTTGPLIDFTVNGQTPGSVIELAEHQAAVAVQAEVHSPVPFSILQIDSNDPSVRVTSSSQGSFPWSAQLRQEISIPCGGWLAASCLGTEGQLLAITSPVYIDAPGKSPLGRQEARKILTDIMTSLLARAQEERPGNSRLVHLLQDACGYV